MADASPNFASPPPDLAAVAVSGDISAAAVTTAAAARHDGLPFHQYMLAGSAAGVVEHTAMFPVDTIKTRVQATAASAAPCRTPTATAVAGGRILRALAGAAGLYRGVSAMCVGAGPAHAVYFSVYEVAKDALTSPAASAGDAAAAHAAAGVAATVASDAVLTPMDTVKQRLQLSGSPYRGVADCVVRILRDEGFKALYASYRTTVLMNAPFTAVHFATYEAAKRGLAGGLLRGDTPEEEEGLAVHATAGAAAGALAAAVTTPLDVVKTQLQCQGVCGCDRYSNSSIGEVIQTIVRRDGYSGLMRGWKPRMFFHAPAAAICWSTYEAAKSFFQRLNDAQKTA